MRTTTTTDKESIAVQLRFDDASHEYHLDGRRCKSVTAVAKIAVDDSKLKIWNECNIAQGFAISPELGEQVGAAVGNNDAIARVVEEAKRAAGAHRAAVRGSQIHRVLELVLLGRTDQLLTSQQHVDADALRATLDVYGLEPTQYVE